MTDPNRLYRQDTRSRIDATELRNYFWAQNAAMLDKYALVHGNDDPRIVVLRAAIARRSKTVACAMLKELGDLP